MGSSRLRMADPLYLTAADLEVNTTNTQNAINDFFTLHCNTAFLNTCLYGLLKISDNIHDFGNGLRSERNEPIKQSLQTYLTTLYQGFDAACASYKLPNPFNNVEDSTREVYEKAGIFSFMNDKLVERTYDQIIAYYTSADADGLQNVINEALKLREAQESQLQVSGSSISDSHYAIIHLFIKTFLHGDSTGTNGIFYTFDANAVKVRNIIKQSRHSILLDKFVKAYRLITPQNVADSAITTWEEYCGTNTTLYAFPKNNKINEYAITPDSTAFTVGGPADLFNKSGAPWDQIFLNIPEIADTTRRNFIIWDDIHVTVVYSLSSDILHELSDANEEKKLSNKDGFNRHNKYKWSYKIHFKRADQQNYVKIKDDNDNDINLMLDLSYSDEADQAPSVDQLAKMFYWIITNDNANRYKHTKGKQIDLSMQITDDHKRRIKELIDIGYNIFFLIKILGDWGQIFGLLFLRANKDLYQFSTFISIDPTACILSRALGVSTWQHYQHRHRLYRCPITEMPLPQTKLALMQIKQACGAIRNDIVYLVDKYMHTVPINRFREIFVANPDDSVDRNNAILTQVFSSDIDDPVHNTKKLDIVQMITKVHQFSTTYPLEALELATLPGFQLAGTPEGAAALKTTIINAFTVFLQNNDEFMKNQALLNEIKTKVDITYSDGMIDMTGLQTIMQQLIDSDAHVITLNQSCDSLAPYYKELDSPQIIQYCLSLSRFFYDNLIVDTFIKNIYYIYICSKYKPFIMVCMIFSECMIKHPATLKYIEDTKKEIIDTLTLIKHNINGIINGVFLHIYPLPDAAAAASGNAFNAAVILHNKFMSNRNDILIDVISYINASDGPVPHQTNIPQLYYDHTTYSEMDILFVRIKKFDKIDKKHIKILNEYNELLALIYDKIYFDINYYSHTIKINAYMINSTLSNRSENMERLMYLAILYGKLSLDNKRVNFDYDGIKEIRNDKTLVYLEEISDRSIAQATSGYLRTPIQDYIFLYHQLAYFIYINDEFRTILNVILTREKNSDIPTLMASVSKLLYENDYFFPTNKNDGIKDFYKSVLETGNDPSDYFLHLLYRYLEPALNLVIFIHKIWIEILVEYNIPLVLDTDLVAIYDTRSKTKKEKKELHLKTKLETIITTHKIQIMINFIKNKHIIGINCSDGYKPLPTLVQPIIEVGAETNDTMYTILCDFKVNTMITLFNTFAVIPSVLQPLLIDTTSDSTYYSEINSSAVELLHTLRTNSKINNLREIKVRTTEINRSTYLLPYTEGLGQASLGGAITDKIEVKQSGGSLEVISKIKMHNEKVIELFNHISYIMDYRIFLEFSDETLQQFIDDDLYSKIYTVYDDMRYDFISDDDIELKIAPYYYDNDTINDSFLCRIFSIEDLDHLIIKIMNPIDLAEDDNKEFDINNKYYEFFMNMIVFCNFIFIYNIQKININAINSKEHITALRTVFETIVNDIRRTEGNTGVDGLHLYITLKESHNILNTMCQLTMINSPYAYTLFLNSLHPNSLNFLNTTPNLMNNIFNSFTAIQHGIPQQFSRSVSDATVYNYSVNIINFFSMNDNVLTIFLRYYFNSNIALLNLPFQVWQTVNVNTIAVICSTLQQKINTNTAYNMFEREAGDLFFMNFFKCGPDAFIQNILMKTLSFNGIKNVATFLSILFNDVYIYDTDIRTINTFFTLYKQTLFTAMNLDNPLNIAYFLDELQPELVGHMYAILFDTPHFLSVNFYMYLRSKDIDYFIAFLNVLHQATITHFFTQFKDGFFSETPAQLIITDPNASLYFINKIMFTKLEYIINVCNSIQQHFIFSQMFNIHSWMFITIQRLGLFFKHVHYVDQIFTQIKNQDELYLFMNHLLNDIFTFIVFINAGQEGHNPLAKPNGLYNLINKIPNGSKLIFDTILAKHGEYGINLLITKYPTFIRKVQGSQGYIFELAVIAGGKHPNHQTRSKKLPGKKHKTRKHKKLIHSNPKPKCNLKRTKKSGSKQNATLHTTKARSASRRLRRVLRATHATRKTAS